MATMVVMYTLKPARAEDGSARLLGPINRRVYASYAPKRHAFAIARREADKRGFTEESGRLVQIVTDGDEDLARYRLEFFPEAIHTLDVSTSSSVSGRLQAALWVVSANGPSVTASNACLTCGEPW